jgi:hypothetical protein
MDRYLKLIQATDSSCLDCGRDDCPLVNLRTNVLFFLFGVLESSRIPGNGLP